MLSIASPLRAVRIFGFFASVPATMGKKKPSTAYNDFLDGEKLHDNTQVRTSLNATPPEEKHTAAEPTFFEAPRSDKNLVKNHGGLKGKKPPLTHFLCLPLVTDASRPQLQSGLEKLKEDIEEDSTVPAKAIRPIGTIHLTLGVMSLTEPQLQAVREYLQSLSLHDLIRNITIQKAADRTAEGGAITENLDAATMPDTSFLAVDLQELRPMHSPSRTSILYAAPEDPTKRLLPFASALKDDLMQNEFLVNDTRPLKLHATIINTVYAKPNKTNRNSHSMYFDARDLIDKYKDFTWAEAVRIDRIQICKMGAKKHWSSGQEGQREVVDERYEVVFEKRLDE